MSFLQVKLLAVSCCILKNLVFGINNDKMYILKELYWRQNLLYYRLENTEKR